MEENTVLCHNHRNCKLGCSTWTEVGFRMRWLKLSIIIIKTFIIDCVKHKNWYHY